MILILIYQNWWASFLTCLSLSLSLLFPTITIGTTSLLGRRPRDVQSSSFTYKKRSSIKLLHILFHFFTQSRLTDTFPSYSYDVVWSDVEDYGIYYKRHGTHLLYTAP